LSKKTIFTLEECIFVPPATGVGIDYKILFVNGVPNQGCGTNRHKLNKHTVGTNCFYSIPMLMLTQTCTI